MNVDIEYDNHFAEWYDGLCNYLYPEISEIVIEYLKINGYQLKMIRIANRYNYNGKLIMIDNTEKICITHNLKKINYHVTIQKIINTKSLDITIINDKLYFRINNDIYSIEGKTSYVDEQIYDDNDKTLDITSNDIHEQINLFHKFKFVFPFIKKIIEINGNTYVIIGNYLYLCIPY